MTQITVRQLPDEVKTRMRVKAAEAGRSMEAEARAALIKAFGAGDGEMSLLELRDYIRRTWKGKRPKSMVDDLIAERRREAKREAARGW